MFFCYTKDVPRRKENLRESYSEGKLFMILFPHIMIFIQNDFHKTTQYTTINAMSPQMVSFTINISLFYFSLFKGKCSTPEKQLMLFCS